MENINAFENFNNSIDDTYIEDDFPVKNHRSASRRKKTFFKGKKRYDLARQIGYIPDPKDEYVLRGMMRKTCAVNGNVWKGASSFKTNRGTIRRQLSANDKTNEYTMED